MKDEGEIGEKIKSEKKKKRNGMKRDEKKKKSFRSRKRKKKRVLLLCFLSFLVLIDIFFDQIFFGKKSRK
jgi:t-SNARE complex subunit (syntaxin)